MASAFATKRRTARSRRPTAAHIATNSYTLPIPERARTLAGFRAWVKDDAFPDKLRVAFIEGEIYLDMSNEELETHVMVKGEISRCLMNLNRDLDLGRFLVDGALITNVEAQVSNNP